MLASLPVVFDRPCVVLSMRLPDAYSVLTDKHCLRNPLGGPGSADAVRVPYRDANHMFVDGGPCE